MYFSNRKLHSFLNNSNMKTPLSLSKNNGLPSPLCRGHELSFISLN